MKISLKWLNDHVDILDYADKADELSRILTDAGLEVEAVENRASTFDHVVVGHILKLERHPNADRLTVCQLDVGDGTPRQIVCGAKNHKQGDKVVVTLPGAVLPGNFEIKKSKIRDVESQGMLASESELGLTDEAEGIMILPADAPVGRSFAAYMGFDDVVFELKITPNRADCLSHLGLARELSCLLDRPLKTPKIEVKTDPAVLTKAKVGLEVVDFGLCPRYAGRVVEGVTVGESPAWLKTRLESVGLKSINNVVDVTNFVMMDLGQPMHAFDLARLSGPKIVVTRATAGETFVTLDGSELKLTGEELTIRDADRAVALAGVIGGQNSGVAPETKAVFLESAHFVADGVRRTARRHGIQTDSAYRFSRGTDPLGVRVALDRAAALLHEVAGGRIAADLWDEFPRPPVTNVIEVTAAYVSERLGYPLTTAELEATVRRLGAQVEAGPGEVLRVTAPAYRVDLERPADLVEEFGRLRGYDKIPERLPPLTEAPLRVDPGFSFERRVAALARAAGLSQSVNYAFVNAQALADLVGDATAWTTAGLTVDAEPVRLKNPLSEELAVMRTSLLPGLFANLLHNVRHGQGHGRIFEIGAAFGREGEAYLEEPRFAAAAWGLADGLWDKGGDDARVFFDLKARVTQMLERLQIQAQWKSVATPPGFAHPGRTAVLFAEGRNVGWLAALHPRLADREKLRVGVALAEINLKSLGRGQPRVAKFKSVAKFPAVERDLAFVLPETLAAADVEREIKKAAGAVLQSVRVFDVFRGGTLEAGQVSVAFRLIYQDPNETLSEERLTKLQADVVRGVTGKLAVSVR